MELRTEDQILIIKMCDALCEANERLGRSMTRYKRVKVDVTKFIEKNMVDSEKNIVFRGLWKMVEVGALRSDAWPQ